VAAKRLGIPSIGIERNPKYCQIAASRVSAEMSLGTSNESSSPTAGGGKGGAERKP
jgi:DNA modification methylase